MLSAAWFIVLYICWTSYGSDAVGKSSPSLLFTVEPPHKVNFVNAKGARIECESTGQATNWTLIDGSPVTEVHGLREVSNSGRTTTLILHSFGPESFRPDVHAAVYRCVASEASAGTIYSRDVHVRGVVLQNLDVQVYDSYSIENNPAVLKCHVPTVIAEYVKVAAWIKNDNLLIQPSLDDNVQDKYLMMPTGELHIRNLTLGDSGSRFKCKLINLLTGNTHVSTAAGQLFVTESRGNVSPRISDSPSVVFSNVGQTAVLACTAQGSPAPKIKWFRRESGSSHQVPLVLDGNHLIGTQSALLIRGVVAEDIGTYVCEVSNDVGQERFEITLTVTEPVKVEVNPSVQMASVNDRVQFKCIVHGRPTASVTWIHNGVPVFRYAGKTELIVDSVRASDRGMYQCVAKNDAGMAQASVELRLSEIQPQWEDVFGDVAAFRPGGRILLKCSASGIPIPKILWNVDGIELQNDRDHVHIKSSINKAGHVVSSLELKNVVVEDGGLYSCDATNKAGSIVHAKRVNIYGSLGSRIAPEKLVVSGSNSLWNCPVYGFPISRISWMKDGILLPKDLRQTVFRNGSLFIEDVNKKIDSGTYKCSASDEHGQTVEGNLDVVVMVPPKIVPFEFQDDLLREGMRARLQCVVSDGEVPMNITWLKDGETLLPTLGVLVRVLDDFSSILTISSITPGHNGKYTCMASNRAATVTHTAELSVNGKLLQFLRSLSVSPKIIPFAFLDDQFYKGMRAHVTCAVSQGDLPLTFGWLKDGFAIKSELGVTTRKFDDHTYSLSIENVSSGHSGDYTCVVRNRAGTSKWTAHLSVRVRPKIVAFQFGDLQSEGSPARVVCGLQEGDAPIHISWLKDDVPLIKSDGLALTIHDVDGLSSILSFESLSSKHSGTYTCLANNTAGTARFSSTLLVNVPPKVVPFTFQDGHVVEGLLARVSCVVSRGDLPLSFHWEKDGINIRAEEHDIQMKSFDDYSNVLSIPSVTLKHNGEYSCVASNGAGIARHSAQLIVHVPPRWIVEPRNASVHKGKDILFHCQADGFPTPTLSWTFIRDVPQPNTRKELRTVGNINVFSNGSLLIKNVDSSDEGYYYCKATNGVGSGLNTRTQVKILSPPTFKAILPNINTTIGSDVTLKCVIQGDFPIKVTWIKGSEQVSESQPRYKIDTKSLSSEISSSLSISKISRDDNDIFQCVGENNYGKNITNIHLIIHEKPDPPSDFKASMINSRYVELTWHSQYQGNSPIQRYVIQYKEAQNSWDESVTMETSNGEPKNSVVTHLHPSTPYVFRIFSENKQGRSDASQLLRVTTKEDVPSGPPLNVQVESVNTETFKVTWKAPEEKLWNGNLLGYYVGYKEVDTEDPYLYKTLLTPTPNADDLAVQIGGAKQFTKYAVVVQAYNGRGKGPQSEPVIIMTSEGAPNLAPTDVRCTTLTSQSFHVTWTAPPSDSINGILRGYKVLYRPASDWFEDIAESYNLTLPTSLTIDHLEKFSNYSVEVLAMTKTAEGPRSSPIFCKTLDDVPGPPVDIKAIATTDDSVIVAWKQPDHPNGVIRSYSIYWKSVDNPKDAGVHTVPVRENSYEVTGLRKGHRFEFYVTASTMVGEGLPSRMVTQLPSGPTVAAKIVSFEDKVITPWRSDIDIPCHAVGIPEPERKWTFKGKMVDLSGRAKISSDGTLSIKNILEVDAGDYVCQVHNGYGEDAITYTIIVLAPPLAPLVEVTSVTLSTIEIQWKTPSSKMSRMKGYLVSVRKADTESWKEVTVGADVRSHKLTSLDCGTKYEVTVTAFNKIGTGAPSEILQISTNGSVPVAPSKTDLVEESSNSISIYLNTWKNGGCLVRHYVVEYAPKSSGEWTVASKDIKPERRHFIVSDLRPATWYSLRVTANNGAGSTIAHYDFATLTSSGATISPDIQSDAASNHLEGLWTYLNVYVILPVICTAIILVVILVVACICLTKSRNNVVRCPVDNRNRLSTGSSQLKHGESVDNFSYMQRNSASRSGGKNKRGKDDITPYETLQLANQRPSSHGHMAGRPVPPIPPPLPPPRMEFHPSRGISNNQQFFNSEPTDFAHGHGSSETTFLFPNAHHGGGMIPSHFPPQYPHDAMKACFE